MKYESHFIKVREPEEGPISRIPIHATEEKQAVAEFKTRFEHENTDISETKWVLMCIPENRNECVEYEIIL